MASVFPQFTFKHTAREKAMKFEKGTKIRVRITGRVGDKPSDRPGMLNTTQVTQTGNGGWEHYIYLDSDKVSGDKVKRGIVQAEFDAMTTGEFERSPNSTTQVRELGSSGSPVGFTHFLFVDSPEITVITDDKPKPSPAPVRSDGEIRRDQRSISSYEVADRITELERGRGGYNVVRTRNDEVLNKEPFPTLEDAQKFIDTSDYNPVRVAARELEQNADDAAELTFLEILRDNVASRTGRSTWVIYGERFFNADWAREQVIAELGVSAAALDRWPLDELVWDTVADKRRDSSFPEIYKFRGGVFYGAKR